MDRRAFLKFATSGVIATATAAEVGMWAEFMSWIRRSPAWSFSSQPFKFPIDPLFSQIDAITLESIRKSVISDNFFMDSPFQKALRSRQDERLSGGLWVA